MDGKYFILDNFRKLKAWGLEGFRAQRNLIENKGQKECAEAFIKAIRNGTPAPISIDEIFEVHEWLFKAAIK